MLLPQPLAKALLKVAALVTHYFPGQDWCSLAGEEVCHPNATCQNFAWNFNCLCKDGFTGNGTTCTLMDSCSVSGSDVCDPNANCKDTMPEGFVCTCILGFRGIGTTCTALPKDCQDIQNEGVNASGFYEISPAKGSVFEVYGDMDTEGGGWTVIQRRSDPNTDFYRKWNEYKHGFSNPTSKDGWIGNDALHLLTSSKNYTLRIGMEDFGNSKYWAEYKTFAVGPERDQYRLTLHGYSGSKGLMDALTRHNNQRFFTRDRDISNRAKIFHTGWWFATGFTANPNGILSNSPKHTFQSVYWSARDGRFISLKSSRMMLRAQ